MYIWYIHFFVYIIYTKNCIYILLYIQLYIQYIYTVYEIWKWAVYMYIYSVYEILRFCIYTCIYTTLSIAKLTCSNIVRLRFLKSILIVYLYTLIVQIIVPFFWYPPPQNRILYQNGTIICSCFLKKKNQKSGTIIRFWYSKKILKWYKNSNNIMVQKLK